MLLFLQYERQSCDCGICVQFCIEYNSNILSLWSFKNTENSNLSGMVRCKKLFRQREINSLLAVPSILQKFGFLTSGDRIILNDMIIIFLLFFFRWENKQWWQVLYFFVSQESHLPTFSVSFSLFSFSSLRYEASRKIFKNCPEQLTPDLFREFSHVSCQSLCLRKIQDFIFKKLIYRVFRNLILLQQVIKSEQLNATST